SIAVAVHSAGATTHTIAHYSPPRTFAYSSGRHGFTPNDFVKRKLGNYNAKLFVKCSESIRASFKQAALKRGYQTKKAGGASRSLYQCPAEPDPLVGQADQSIWGSWILEGLATATATPAHPFIVNSLVKRKLSNYNAKLFAKSTQSIRASFKEAAIKRGYKAKKAGVASRLLSQSLSEPDYLVGQVDQSIWGSSVLEALNIVTPSPAQPFAINGWVKRKLSNYNAKLLGKCPQSIRASFKVAVLKRGYKTKRAGVTSSPRSQYPSALDPNVGIPMDLDVEQQLSPHPDSLAPMPMEFEAEAPSTHATPNSQSQQTPFETSTGVSLGAAVQEFVDTIMRDAGETSCEAERASQIESTSIPFIDSISRESISTPSEDVEMEIVDDSRSLTPLQPTSTPFIQPAGASSPSSELQRYPQIDAGQLPARTSSPTATIDAAFQEGAPAQSLSASHVDAITEPEQPTEVAPNEETDVTRRLVAPTPSLGSVSTSPGTTASTPSLPAATSSPTTASSTAGPSTPTLSGQSGFTPEQGQPPLTHAARLHQALRSWGRSKQASTSPQPAVGETASEKAETEAFLAKCKAIAQAKSKPTPPPGPSEPKPTEGSAARSLMDDIMAGFRGVPRPRPSPQQAPAAAGLPARPNHNATNHPRPPPVVQSSAPIVAGRQRVPRRSTQPDLIGTGPVCAAPGGSVIPSRSAPSAVPMLGQANAGGQTVPRRSTQPTLIGTGLGRAAPGGSVIPSRSAPPAVPMLGQANGSSGSTTIQAGSPSEAVPPITTAGSLGPALGSVQSGERAIQGSRRVTQAMTRTGLSWQLVQQRAREAQAASNAMVSNSIASLSSVGQQLAQSSEPQEAEPIVKRRCM
ncbi:hypothetical protein FRC01_004633, partial [Tulasnella sp. 417]